LQIRHDYFEGLCAIAVSGQIALPELTELKKHTETCADCQAALADFSRIVAHALPEFAAERMPLTPPPGMTDRFVARAHSEGIPLSNRDDRADRRTWFGKAVRVTVPLLAATLLLSFGWKFLNWRLQARHTRSAPIAAGAGATGNEATKAELIRANLAQQAAGLQNRVNELSVQLASDQKALRSAQSERLQLDSRLAEIEKANTGVRQDLTERETQLAQRTDEAARVKAELAKLALAKTADEYLVQEERSELNSLRSKIDSLSEQLTESQQLSAAANQAKDLIVARHLHIVDVDDTDGDGRRLRPFGRIFYSEGQSLVFYAYDLSDPRKLNTKINFYVWGSQEGVNKPVQSLGIFHTDDAKEARWVLRFDDPHVLSKINCVFVTAESDEKNVTQPTGKQILFASLGSKANHP
jgi:hypothetical protein